MTPADFFQLAGLVADHAEVAILYALWQLHQLRSDVKKNSSLAATIGDKVEHLARDIDMLSDDVEAIRGRLEKVENAVDS